MSESRSTVTETAAQAEPGKYRNPLVQAALLMAVWLILSEHYDLLHVLYGVFSVAVVTWLNLRLRALPLVENEPAGVASVRIGRLLLYLPWLLWQIIQSGVYVAYKVLQPRLDVQPEILRFRSRQPSVMAKVILGNSITLTPGTLTLDIRGDTFYVHALTGAVAHGLSDGNMPHWVASLYHKECPPEQLCSDVVHLDTRDGLAHG